MREFSTIAGLILDQLLEHHPIRVNISDYPVMLIMGVTDPTDKLESGRMFKEMFGATLQWLNEEEFVHGGGLSPRERLRLTTKALAVLNAVPPNLGGRSIGDSIAEAKNADAPEARNRIATFFGDFIGSAAGSFPKSAGSGG
ncbi:hypothetical protein C7G41_24040 [Bradyrhizobium sp. MOS002]|nr:hypothetical protein C7G41_24040 [Bradyrhizobium sp. MOS002]